MRSNAIQNLTNRLIVALAVMPAAPYARETAVAGAAAVEDDVRQAVGKGDAIMAYRKDDLTQNGAGGLVVVVSHAVHAGGAGGRCELIVFARHGGSWRPSASNRRVVDCPRDASKGARDELASQDFLDVSPGMITWTNGSADRWEAFDFFYDATARDWFALSISAGWRNVGKDNEGGATRPVTWSGSVGAPHDFALTRMADFDPETLQTALVRHVGVTP